MIAALPHIVAALNALSGILLVIGYTLIRQGRRIAHHKIMTAAVITSGLFLVFYVLHHIFAPVFVFPGQGIVRPIYFTMLISHVCLSILVAPMVAVTYVRARGGRFDRHKAIAHWTLPIWLYVSVTGIAVYVLLYHVYGMGRT